MLEIKGRVSTALCYAQTIDTEAVEQIHRLCDQEFTRGSRIRMMPDAHWGKGCTIGTTMTVTDKAVPNVVGVDIGCGMYTVRLENRDIDMEKLDEAAHFIPSGREIWEGRQTRFDLQPLRCYRSIQDSRKMVRSLGTLGGGNHFIEVDRASDGTLYLIIHSGSRNLGKQVAEYYQKLAIDLHSGKEEYFQKKDALIAEYKAAGRRDELQQVIRGLRWTRKELTIPEELCYVYGSYFEDYLADVDICQQFAKKNRELIAEILMDRGGLKGGEAFHTVHNYIDVEERILRKGAVSAKNGELLLIPVNMRDGSILAVGRGNPEWNDSAPHGAGRIMSRMEAKRTLDLEEYRRAMEGIYTTSVNEHTLDEAPMVYKSLEEILETVEETVDIVDLMKPVYNFKFHGWHRNAAEEKTEDVHD